MDTESNSPETHGTTAPSTASGVRTRRDYERVAEILVAVSLRIVRKRRLVQLDAELTEEP